MDIQKLVEFNGVLLIKEDATYGSLAGVNFLNQTINVVTEGENGELELYEGLKIDDVEFVEFICELGDEIVMNRDIIAIANNNYEIEILEDRNVTLHLLNDELERVMTGNPIPFNDVTKHFAKITQMANVEVVGNMYEVNLLAEEIEDEEVGISFDFDIKIAKEVKDGYIQYLYVCNNKEKEEIDLINVVFVGAEILDGTYKRETISYDEYEAMVLNGRLTEVSQGELRNYALGMLHVGKPTVIEDEDGFEYEEEDECDCEYCLAENNEQCRDCGEFVEDCDCL